ncbi:hypothetical protein J2TS6_07770 [Paenibacillus albilobatus]|uniref:Uncharacterized protein n=1 Tax=Paenibacillus albilobatus TaxID=2716884 RepID=A0A920C828_9BACL|nr:hypothetical protein J2TS6_07770 [Paenibacillus albilobatus]
MIKDFNLGGANANRTTKEDWIKQAAPNSLRGITIAITSFRVPAGDELHIPSGDIRNVGYLQMA